MADEEDSNSEENEDITANYEYELDVILEDRPPSIKQVEYIPPPLSTFNKTVIRCILNECVDQLYILRNINTQDNANFIRVSVEYASIGERYRGVESHADYRINSSINNYEKLARDIHKIIQIMKECQDDVHANGKFETLKSAVDAMKRMREDERKLIEEKEKNDQYIVELRKQCEEEFLKNIRVIEETNSRIQKLRFEVEDVHVYKRYELNYFENWENARKEQNAMSCEQSEQYYQKIIDDTKNNIYAETRCHTEFENYIEESKNVINF